MPQAFDLHSARAFVAGADLPALAGGFALAAPDIVFERAREQSLVIGSQVLSFDAGVEPEFREAISDSALLAQLVANKTVSATADPIAWFDAYFAVLGNIGWVTQARDTATYDITTDGMAVHEAILPVVTAFVGSIPGAVALVKLALESLKAMDADTPLITLFNRESQHARIGRFQFTLVRQDAGGGLLAEAMAFVLEADKTITQILFFKLSQTQSKLRRSLGSVSLNTAALTALRPVVRGKVQAYMAGYVAALDLGPVPG